MTQGGTGIEKASTTGETNTTLIATLCQAHCDRTFFVCCCLRAGWHFKPTWHTPTIKGVVSRKHLHNMRPIFLTLGTSRLAACVSCPVGLGWILQEGPHLPCTSWCGRRAMRSGPPIRNSSNRCSTLVLRCPTKRIESTSGGRHIITCVNKTSLS